MNNKFLHKSKNFCPQLQTQFQTDEEYLKQFIDVPTNYDEDPKKWIYLYPFGLLITGTEIEKVLLEQYPKLIEYGPMKYLHSCNNNGRIDMYCGIEFLNGTTVQLGMMSMNIRFINEHFMSLPGYVEPEDRIISLSEEMWHNPSTPAHKLRELFESRGWHIVD